MASVEITIDPPGSGAAAALVLAVVVIDLVALRRRRSTVSRWVRHQVRRRPAVTLTLAAMLGLHLIAEVPIDPLRGFASWLDRRTR